MLYSAPFSPSEEFFCTVGCHPTRCSEFETTGDERYLSELKTLASEQKEKVVAVGECGLGECRE